MPQNQLFNINTECFVVIRQDFDEDYDSNTDLTSMYTGTTRSAGTGTGTAYTEKSSVVSELDLVTMRSSAQDNPMHP
jgi:hypothetical protein